MGPEVQPSATKTTEAFTIDDTVEAAEVGNYNGLHQHCENFFSMCNIFYACRIFLHR